MDTRTLATAILRDTRQALEAKGLSPDEATVRSAAAAVLNRLGGEPTIPGLFAFKSSPAQLILAVADEIESSDGLSAGM